MIEFNHFPSLAERYTLTSLIEFYHTSIHLEEGREGKKDHIGEEEDHVGRENHGYHMFFMCWVAVILEYFTSPFGLLLNY